MLNPACPADKELIFKSFVKMLKEPHFQRDFTIFFASSKGTANLQKLRVQQNFL
jgi:hypothetical protein